MKLTKAQMQAGYDAWQQAKADGESSGDKAAIVAALEAVDVETADLDRIALAPKVRGQ